MHLDSFLTVVFWIVAVAAILTLFTRVILRGKSLSAFDTDIPITFDSPEPSDGAKAVEDYLRQTFSSAETLHAKRQRFDAMGDKSDFGCTFVSQTAEFNGIEVPGEWTLVDGADQSKRLLYVHGGAFMLGSPKSHRPIIANIARRTGCVIFAPDYRLMPENKRIGSILDSRAAYQWLLANGPDGASVAEKIAVAGDSAGGNLALCLVNWLRDAGLRMPDAVVALSPATDSSGTSPSIRGNLKTDLMLRPLASQMLKIPHGLLMWVTWAAVRIMPSSKLISPVRDDLSGLPPTLVHASSTEILYDDARRYVNKAISQGSPVKFQSWAHLCHVWHMFDEMLPEAHHAFDEIADFMRAHGVAK